MNSIHELAGHDDLAPLLHGAIELERSAAGGVLPHRLPDWARAQADGQLAMAESQPSGVRLVFRTRANVIELDTVPTKLGYVGAPPRPEGVYDLVIDGALTAQATATGGNSLTVDMMSGTSTFQPGAPTTVRFDQLGTSEKTAEIWLPWNETTEIIALRTDAPVSAVPVGGRRRWLHHGSSISHGSFSSSPTATWPATAAALGEVELTNLGFGGSALLDPFTARTIRDTPADLISVKIGINLVNTDLMRLRAFAPAVNGFLDLIREGHPDTPLLVISAICCPIHEDTPGPTLPDFSAMKEGGLRFRAAGNPDEVAAGKLTLNVTRSELKRILEERSKSDQNIAYLDGRELYGESDAIDVPLPDDLHPGPETQRLIGERFARLAFEPGGTFGDAR
ncbi:SGNH/GDSL hydrolase family protein [Acrocarpospora catenulata]|uniref:SGNH/GDSL hydrolase family protein n=1 Tax=Acrocarpospora catenulata TaxID=2836182 RepID=UPI001BDAB5CD|nr:SGNH/GDSL hydrolase family protein [Acrocarpospora catenulata]